MKSILCFALSKIKIAPEDAVMVGDRSYDMIGAKNNKVLGLEFYMVTGVEMSF